jgi:uncharacterized protein YdeI (YjbR/CyaY-like superfamily)
VKKVANVDDYVEKHSEWKSILLPLRKILKNTQMEETIKWGAPVYTLSGKNVVGIGAFKSYAGLWFFNGTLLNDKNNKLVNAQEGKTKSMRQWRFTKLDELDEMLVEKYVAESIELEKAGKKILNAKPTKKIEIPFELESALLNDEQLSIQFNLLTPYKQKEFAEHIDSAKRKATRLSRLEKCIPLILKGIGLHDKYRNC